MLVVLVWILGPRNQSHHIGWNKTLPLFLGIERALNKVLKLVLNCYCLAVVRLTPFFICYHCFCFIRKGLMPSSCLKSLYRSVLFLLSWWTLLVPKLSPLFKIPSSGHIIKLISSACWLEQDDQSDSLLNYKSRSLPKSCTLQKSGGRYYLDIPVGGISDYSAKEGTHDRSIV